MIEDSKYAGVDDQTAAAGGMEWTPSDQAAERAAAEKNGGSAEVVVDESKVEVVKQIKELLSDGKIALKMDRANKILDSLGAPPGLGVSQAFLALCMLEKSQKFSIPASQPDTNRLLIHVKMGDQFALGSALNELNATTLSRIDVKEFEADGQQLLFDVTSITEPATLEDLVRGKRKRDRP